jgi:membrane protein implicated in regulation of membrane protease activity
MDGFDHGNTLIWFIAAAVFTLLELAVPGFILVFFGLGALITSISTAAMDLPVETELWVFSISSVVGLVALRRTLRATFGGDTPSADASEVVSDLVGKTGTVTVAIAPGQDGSVKTAGTTWTARSSVAIAANSAVTVTGTDPTSATILIVTPTPQQGASA